MNESNDKKMICGHCGSQLQLMNVSGFYLGYEFHTDLYGCPQCKLFHVPEELVNTKIAQVEALLEEK